MPSAKSTTVCILTAGKGTRMGPMGQLLNKALFPIRGKAIISHIIEQFDARTEYVIALGYLGNQVRDYLSLAHPETRVTYVDVPNWEGKGSGPGTSIRACADKLARPFHFFACDGIWELPKLDQKKNSFSLAPAEENAKSFCNVTVKGAKVSAIYDKKLPPKGKSFFTFTGHAFIKDFKTFFAALDRSKKEVKGEKQIIDGFYALAKSGNLSFTNVQWHDLGTLERYQTQVASEANYDFSKVEESFYHVNGRILKFFSDSKVSRERFERAQRNPEIFPRDLKLAGNFYSYAFEEGQTFYTGGNPEKLKQFLQWSNKHLWIKREVNASEFRRLCEKFYREKTLERVSKFLHLYPGEDNLGSVNGIEVQPVEKILSRIDWNSISKGIPVYFHGDLQFDNILTTPESFKLIDWRQNFAGSIEVGDLYYDLAKLLGGIRLQYDLIKKNLFWYTPSKNGVRYDFAQRQSAHQMEVVLKEFVAAKNLDWNKVETLTGLIYLNMSPLHHAPFSQMLFALGKLTLTELAHANR